MDSVRFGRVLGTGARLAGRTVAAAVDAASAPNPRAGSAGGRTVPPVGGAAKAVGVVLPPERAAAVRVGSAVRERGAGVRRGGRRFGEAVWGPVAKASGVLWLEVTGVFFGLVAVFGVQGLWMYRGALGGTAGPGVMRHFLLAGGLAGVFGYFCVSSFARARKRGRG